MNIIALLTLTLCLMWTLADELHQKHDGVPTRKMQNVMEETPSFWESRAQNYIGTKKDQERNTNKAKNVILFLGDGLNIATVTATRMYMGKEEMDLSFDAFPHYGLARTYCIDVMVADSACTATAYLSGIKTRNKLININGKVKEGQCVVDEENYVDSIAQWAQRAGKATGLVTTTRVTHASPAGVYAHTSHRDWEDHNSLDRKCADVEGANVKDIAYQLVHNEIGKNLKVILGGGRNRLTNATDIDEEGRPGSRTDGRNLINDWITERSKKGEAKFIWHKQQIDEVNYDKTDYLMGLFESDHLLFSLDVFNNNLQNQEPSLTDMTAAALKMLQKEENGFFLFVEGGKIDQAHHDGKVQKALEETKEFSRAIEFAREMTNEADTLIVVTSDHSHTMTYSGYADRGSNIAGIADISDMDGKPYETLSYANGPGYAATFNEDRTERSDFSSQDFKNPNRLASATVPLESESHSSDDVGVFASGPWAHLFTGSYEQNNIPVLMAYAAEIGPYEKSGAGGLIKASFLLMAASSVLLRLMWID